MNYLQEHYDYLKNKGKGVLFCYHDGIVEMQEFENLSSESYKNIVDIEKEFIEKVKEEKSYEWGDTNRTYLSRKYDYHFRDNDFIVLGIEDFKKDFPYFPFDNIIGEMSDTYYWRRGHNNYWEAQIICLAIKYPQLELLYKTNFKKFVIEWIKDPANVVFARCFKNGKNIDEITKLPKYAWTLIADRSRNIKEYNEMRIWVQKENLSKEQLEEVFNQNLYKPELEKVRKLCTRTFNDKKLYTLDTLLNYLHRCDVYQAIPAMEAIDLLNDYIKMSIDMNVEPLTNSNSLKREHDVTVRNYNQWYRANRNAMIEDSFKKRSEYLQKYEYENDKYIVITPHCVNELLEEANNQRNCLACYADYYAKGRAQIFFMRKKNQKDKSYISIELNQDLTEFRQVYYGCNRPVDNPDDLQFLNEWLEHIKTVK